MSSQDHFSNKIGSDFSGRNTSSIRFARDIIGGIAGWLDGGTEVRIISPIFHFSTTPCIAETACDSCPLPPSMMMRSGQLSSHRRAQSARLVSISSIEAKSSILPVSRVFILYFLYLFVSGFQFTRTDLLATVCSP